MIIWCDFNKNYDDINLGTFIVLEDKIEKEVDGKQEIILRLEPYGTQLALHSEDNTVYVWAFKLRTMKNIKIDGMFENSDGAADTEIGKLKFADGECYCEELCIDDELKKGKEIYRLNKKTSTRKKVEKYIEEQNQKEEVVWMIY